MTQHPRIHSVATAYPPFAYPQGDMIDLARTYTLGEGWRDEPASRESADMIEHLFRASRVEQRRCSVDLAAYYSQSRSTGERMATYQTAAYAMGHESLTASLAQGIGPEQISDFIVVSCTGYSAPGLDIQLARDLGMPRDVRRVCVGHMGCFGAMVGLRQALAAVRAYEGAVVTLLSVEATSLHFTPSLEPEVLTSFALFGDAAASLTLSNRADATGPALVDVYCSSDFGAANQMSWTITDLGFVMTLSPRVPVTLRRNIRGVVDHLLTPHGLAPSDVAHWLVHPGGPSILDAIAGKLELTDAQMARSWDALARHGNCSSATVLVILEDLMRSGTAKPGEWGVMMAFGPGLTLETCLLQF